MVQLKRTLPATIDFDAWLATLELRWSPGQVEVVRSAHAVAADFCRGQVDPYACLLRSLAVADTLADLRLDHEVVAAALLYEAVDSGGYSLHQVEEAFGAAISRLVEGIVKLDVIGDFHHRSHPQGQQLESLRKMLLAMAEDVRVVLIKLALRLRRLRSLGDLPEDQRKRIARETLDIFAPLANRLGIGQLKWELEDLALRYLDPFTYKRLAKALDERRTDREHYIAQVVERLKAELAKHGIHAEVYGRVKHINSIWRKMQRKALPFEEIFDVRAVRIIVPTLADCYAALGVVHSLWTYIPKEFDDYIANPKDNGYQSLHTAVVGPESKTLEVQIRTPEMHQNAELGVAAHWRYKEGDVAHASAFERQIAWLRQMLEWKDEDGAEGDFLDRFKAEAFQDRVYVLTPKGAIVEMEQGATPLDFAYHVHTEIGHRCRGAKVNGRIVPLTYELKNSEQVEVLTAKQGGPSRDWLSPHLGYLKTSRARAKVRHWFRHQDQEKKVAGGRAALEKEFHRLDVDFKKVDLEQLASKLNYTRLEDLFAAVGHGDLTTGQVAAKAQELILPPPPPETLPITRKGYAEEGGGEIKIRGVGNLLTQIARCCQPVPFDPIVGYITHGRGVTVHRQDCANLLDLASRHRERLIDVDWGEAEQSVYPVDVQIEAFDRAGLIRDISSVLANEKINVLAMNTVTDPKTASVHMAVTLQITDLGQLSRALDRLGQIRNVTEARRKR